MATRAPRQAVGWIVGTSLLMAVLCQTAAGQASRPSAPTPATQPVPATQPAEPPATQPAEPEDETVRPRRKDILHLDYLDGYAQFESQYDQQRARFPVKDNYSPVRTQRQTNRLWAFQESFGLRAAGDIVDPGWFTYNMALQLDMDQTVEREVSPFAHLRDHGSGWLGAYNINLGLLQSKPLHFDVYSSREDGRVNRLFLPSLWHEAWRTGVTAFFENDRFPMELTFEQTRDAYSGDFDRYDTEDLKDTMLRFGGTANFTPHHKLRLDYQRNERHERYLGSRTRFDTTQNVLRLDDQVRFGSRRQHLWQNTLEYEEDEGDLPRDHIYAASRLALQHSKKLTTEYKYEYTRDKYGDTTAGATREGKAEGITLDTHRFDWLATWRPKDGLTTTGNLFAEHDKSDEGLSSNLFGSVVRVAGSRENRYGTLSGTAGYQFHYVDTDFSDRQGTQVTETITFRHSLVTFLAHSDVDEGSIIVTDLNRTRMYYLAKDYLVARTGRYVGLVRLPFGRIQQDQAVRVIYRYRTIRSGRFQTHQFDTRIQQDFKSGWTPYYEVILRRQSIDTSDNYFFEPNNIDRHRLGLTYHRKTWLAGGELEFDDETIDPYNAAHVHGNWTILQRPADRLAIRGEVAKYWFRSLEERKPIIFDIGGDYRRTLTRRLEASIVALYRHEHDSVLGTTNGVDVTAGVAYKIGQLTVTADLEYDMLDVQDSDQDGLGLWIKVRRDFPGLLGKQR